MKAKKKELKPSRLCISIFIARDSTTALKYMSTRPNLGSISIYGTYAAQLCGN